jgi:hypothetical protein
MMLAVIISETSFVLTGAAVALCWMGWMHVSQRPQPPETKSRPQRAPKIVRN